jgi:prephenate dehydratase
MEFVAAINHCSMLMLDNIMMMDEIVVLYYTPQIKRQSKQWIKRGFPRTACQPNQADSARLFNSQGFMYMHIILRSIIINAKYTVVVLGKF